MFNFFKNIKLDVEYRELIESHNRVKADASEIRDFLFAVLADAQNGIEKFGDTRLLEAGEIIDRIGPGAFYWMTDIAAQMVLLSTAKLNGIATSVDHAITVPVTAEQIVAAVVRV